MMMQKVLRAFELMVTLHGTAVPVKNRFCKYRNISYAVHPARVARKVDAYLTDCPSANKYIPHTETMLIVSALHDVVEDTRYSLETIKQEFGAEVRNGIRWLTNPSKEYPELSRDTRKELDRKHLADAPDHFKIIKLFDRIDNIYDVINGPMDFVLNVYVPESRLLESVLRTADPLVGDLLLSACDWIEALTKGKKPAIV